MNVKDKNGREIREGDTVRYYDSTTMWLTGKVINVGSALAVETDENPILLYEFACHYTTDYVYDGKPIAELELLAPLMEEIAAQKGKVSHADDSVEFSD